MKTSHRHSSQITPGRLVLLVESPSLRRGVMSGHVYLSIISTGYSVHGGLLMCDHGCDGFPSLDLVGNPSIQVSIIFMYLLLCSYILRWESLYPGNPETLFQSQSLVLV